MAKQAMVDRPVTGERAPALKVMAPTTPMARMLRERVELLEAEDAAAAMEDDPAGAVEAVEVLVRESESQTA